MKKLMIALVMLFATSSVATADTLGQLFGAIVGTAIGSQVGSGNGKKAAMVVGALAGASIGSRVEDGTYGKDANGDYVCVNCDNTQTARSQYGSAGEEAAAHAGAAEYGARLQCERERNAYYANGGMGPYPCSNGYNGRRSYAGSYYRRSDVEWR